jgi:mediator of RNA polymerase II transcription subunit 14
LLTSVVEMMSLSYQLEILWYQAERMRSLGWSDYLTVEMARDRKSFAASYWVYVTAVLLSSSALSQSD